jgi:putative alpha-1,2-mannosidase
MLRGAMKATQRMRQLMEVWYTDGPLGIPGDDDGGETSSWYVLSAMGFYPCAREVLSVRMSL